MQKECKLDWTNRDRKVSRQLGYVVWQLETMSLGRLYRCLLRLSKCWLERVIPR